MTDTKADLTMENLLVKVCTTPLNSNSILGGFVKPYWTADMTGSSVVSGLSRMCIRPDNLIFLRPKVTFTPRVMAFEFYEIDVHNIILYVDGRDVIMLV